MPFPLLEPLGALASFWWGWGGWHSWVPPQPLFPTPLPWCLTTSPPAAAEPGHRGLEWSRTLSMELVGPCAYLKPLLRECFQTAGVSGRPGLSEGKPRGRDPALRELKIKQTAPFPPHTHPAGADSEFRSERHRRQS